MPGTDQQEREQDDQQPGSPTGENGVVEFDERRAKMERLRAEGIEPYPAVTLWGRRTRIAEIHAAHEPAELEQGEHPDMRYLVAGRLISRRGHGKTAFLDLRDLSGSIQIVLRVDSLGQEPYDRILNLDIGDIVSVDGCVYVTQRGQLALAAIECTLLTKTLRPPPGQAPRPRRHRHALPLPRARPDRQPGDARAVHHAQQDHPRDPRMARRAPLRRDRNARIAVACRRRWIATLHDSPQRARPRPLPAHLGRAVPQPMHRRRHGERLRHGQGVPQRGHLAKAQPGVHDHRVHVRLLRLQRRRDGHRRNVPRRSAEGARTHARSNDAARRSTSPSRGGGSRCAS